MTTSAKMIAHSVGPTGIEIATLQLRYPKFIHGELTTHRVFSRNASSSRAIPVERLIKDVLDDPVYPSFWGKNQAGMQAAEECIADVVVSGATSFTREQYWDRAREAAVSHARAFATADYHKQIVNRLLEPFCHINVVVTSTEWDNFFALRCHPAAQPEMRELAEKMRDALAASTPRALVPGTWVPWHLPYVTDDEREGGRPFEELVKLSVARCARVSYLTQEGRVPTVAEDLALHDRLVGSTPLHASPAEHQATPDPQRPSGTWDRPELHGNLRGWVQYRKMLEEQIAVGLAMPATRPAVCSRCGKTLNRRVTADDRDVTCYACDQGGK